MTNLTKAYVAFLILLSGQLAAQDASEYLYSGMAEPTEVGGATYLENEFPDISKKEPVEAAEEDPGMKSCNASLKSSKFYCEVLNNPMVSMGVQMFQGVTAGVSGGGKSMKDRCEMAATLSQIGAAVNTGLGGSCMASAMTCSSDCERLASSHQAEAATLTEEYSARRKKMFEDINEVKRENNNQIQQEKNLAILGNSTHSRPKYAEIKAANDRRIQKILQENGPILKEKLAAKDRSRLISRKAGINAAHCSELTKNSIPALMQAVQNGAAWAASSNCSKYADAGFDVAAFCRDANNKGHPSCGGIPDCKSATGSQLPQCICADPKIAKTNPICKGYKPGGPGAGVFPTAMGGVGSGDSLSGLNPNEVTGVPAGAGANEALKNDGVQQGGGGGLGGLGASSLNPEENGGQAPDYKTDVTEGYVKGGRGGGGGDMGYMNTSGGGSGGSAGSYKAPNFDLSRFLPGQKKAAQARMLATQGLKAEGVTPAAGPSIWEKVSSRMKAIRGNLR